MRTYDVEFHFSYAETEKILGQKNCQLDENILENSPKHSDKENVIYQGNYFGSEQKRDFVYVLHIKTI